MNGLDYASDKNLLLKRKLKIYSRLTLKQFKLAKELAEAFCVKATLLTKEGLFNKKLFLNTSISKSGSSTLSEPTVESLFGPSINPGPEDEFNLINHISEGLKPKQLL
jgi:hypothetical protein